MNIDEKSIVKAFALFESIFDELFDFAGKIRDLQDE